MARTARSDDSVQVSLVELRQLEDERIRVREREIDEARRAEAEWARAEEARRADAEAARAAERARAEAENERAVRLAAIDADTRIEVERLAAERARHDAERARATAVASPPARRGWIVLGFAILAAAQVATMALANGDPAAPPSPPPDLTAITARLDHLETAVGDLRGRLSAPTPALSARPAASPAANKPPATRPKPPRHPPHQPSNNGRVELDCDPSLPLCASKR